MKTSIFCIAVATSAFALSAHAATACSIVPPAHASDAALAKLAKVSKAKAKQAALDAVTKPGKKTVKSAELEAEHGCLIWSFDIGIAGSRLTHEVAIDAGNAAVLAVTTESSAQEADEARADSAGHPSH
jgi:hypothetical protein